MSSTEQGKETSQEGPALQKKETKYNQLSAEQIKEEEAKANSANPEKETVNIKEETPTADNGKQEKPAETENKQDTQEGNKELIEEQQKTNRSGQEREGSINKSNNEGKSVQNEEIKMNESAGGVQEGSGNKRGSLAQPQSTRSIKNSEINNINKSTLSNNSRNLRTYKSMAFDPYQPDPQGDEEVKEFYDAQKKRVNEEKNAELLGNRIALLRQEELNLLKKIEETRKKALEIYYLKLKKEAAMKKKQQEQQQKREYREKQELEARMKFQEKIIQKQTKVSNDPFEERELTQYERSQRDEAMKIKEQSKKIKRTIERNKKKHEDETLMQKQRTKHDEQQTQNQVYQHYMKKRTDYRQDVRTKKLEEEKKMIMKREEIKSMQKYESELIDRLKHTQQISKHAFDELESALLLSAKDFADQFLKSDELQSENDQQIPHHEEGINEPENSQPTGMAESNIEPEAI